MDTLKKIKRFDKNEQVAYSSGRQYPLWQATESQFLTVDQMVVHCNPTQILGGETP
jgi:hypothetical protein